jgi:hypothetical protein
MKIDHRGGHSSFVMLVLVTLLLLLPVIVSEGRNNLLLGSNNYVTDTKNEDSTKKTCDGYTLITPRYDIHPFLIDMDEREIHEWSIYGFPAKMLPGGTIIGTREAKMVYNFGRKGTL